MKVRTPGGDSLSPWAERPWPVYRVALVAAETLQAPEGLPADVLNRLRVALTAVGGIFRPLDDQSTKTWDLAKQDEAEAFARTAAVVRADDPAAVLAFVNTWGVLDVGFLPLGGENGARALRAFEALQWPGGAPQDEGADVAPLPLEVRELLRCDSLTATQAALQEFQAARRELERLRQPHRPDQPAWRTFFATRLGPRLFSIHPTIRWDRGEGPLPAWDVRTPAELLWITLWGLATTPGQLRHCRHCGDLFSTQDPRKKFCTRSCTNRASAAASYAKAQALRRLAQGDTAAAVAARYGIDPEQVRGWAREARARKGRRRKR